MKSRKIITILAGIVMLAATVSFPVSAGSAQQQDPVVIPTISGGYAETVQFGADTGYGSQYMTFLAGETAFFNAEREVLEVHDPQGRVILQGLGGSRIKFYAWQDGYDLRIDSGMTMMKAGYNYTQNFLGFDWTNEVIEVRQSAGDQLVGYILLASVVDPATGAFMGKEAPIAVVDTNQDMMIGVDELTSAIERIRNMVSGLPKSSAAGYQSEIDAAVALLQQGSIGEGYHKLRDVYAILEASGVTEQEQPKSTGALLPAEQKQKTNLTTLIILLLVFAVIMFVLAFFLIRQGKKDRGNVNN